MEPELSTALVSTRKRRGEGHTRRDEILAAAKKLFLKEGYEATTIRKIAEEVGVSAPALYLYFTDKEAIMLALCDQTFAQLIALITGLEQTVRDPIERLMKFGEAYGRFGLSHPDEYKLVFMGAHMPESLRKVGHRMAIDDPAKPGVGGAIVFSRLVAILYEIEVSGTKLNYPADTCAEFCWMGIHGVVAAMIMKPEFPWSNRDLLITGMLTIVTKGILSDA